MLKAKVGKNTAWSTGLTKQEVNIIWNIIQKLVTDLTDSKKRIYKKEVYDTKYADNTPSRKPKANAIKDAVKESKESAIRNIRGAISKLIKEGRKNQEIAYTIYTNQNYLVRDIISRDGFAGRIFTDRLFRAYEGDNLIEEAKIERKEQKRKQQDEKQYRESLGWLGTKMRTIYKKDEKDRKERKKQEENDLEFSSGDEGTITAKEQADMKIILDKRNNKGKIIQAGELTKAKKYIAKPIKNKLSSELGLDSKAEDKKEVIEDALQLIYVSEDLSLLELSRYYTVLLEYAVTYRVGGTTRESIETLLVNNHRELTAEAEEKRRQSMQLNKEKEDEEKRKQDEIKRQKEERLLKSRTEYVKEEYKIADNLPRLTFSGVTLLESEWKLLLNIATNTVDNTLTAKQRRLNRMRLNDKLKQFAERNDINTPSVQSGLMEYKESLEAREPGRQQQVFKGDTNVKTSTKFGRLVSSLGMISNQNDEIKAEITNASIRSEQRDARASEERYQIYESTMQAINDIDRAIINLSDAGIDRRYLNRVEAKLKQNLPKRRETKDMLSPAQRGIIIQSMPDQIRDTLSPMVDNLLTGNVDMTVLVTGLVGLGFISVTGSPFGAQAIRLATGYLLNTFGINLNDYLYVNNISPPPATPPPRGAPPPITRLPLERKRLITRSELKKSVDGKMTYERQTDALLNLLTVEDLDLTTDSGVSSIVPRLSSAVDSGSDEEFVEQSAENLAENAINELDMKLTEEEERNIRMGARAYIRTQLNNLRIAISQQMATPSGRTTQQLDISNLDLDEIPAELANPLGFFDYIRNIGGLPQAIMNNIPDINLNKLRQAMPVMMEIKSKLPNMPVGGIPGFMRGKQPDLIQPLGPDGKPVPDKGVLRNFVGDMKDRLENIDRKNLPSGDEIKEGVYGGVGGAVVPAVVRGGAMGGVGAIARGGIGGAGVGAVTGPMIRRYYEQQGLDMSDPEVKRHIAKIQALPPMIAGALIGATGIGENLFSGSGITEKKINVDPSVLAETMATEQQDTKQTKKWITKGIFPNPDILDETRQEKFVDDLEFVAFNYIEPSSQGATGTIKTNPLKRSQFLSDQIRYMDAGISMSGMLYNKEFPTNTNQQQLDTYKLGEDMLPVMEFMEQDNADTFTPIGRHYVNNQDIAVEMFSPFSDYSDNRNYWAINERSKLYNLYA